jgi:hypothetical protein
MYNYNPYALVPRRPSPRLMGGIQQQLPAIGGGSPYQFGYNPGVIAGTFGNKIYTEEEIAGVLDDLSYDTRSYVVPGTGPLNPFIAVEGYAVTTWQSGSDFGQEIYNTISGAGYPIDYASIQFRFEPYYPPGATAPPPMVGTPYPTTQTGQQQQQQQTPPQPPGKCDLSKQGFGEWIACQFGLKDPVTGALLGSAGTAIGIGAIALIALVLSKR